jgi:hypothetical protein
VRVGGTDQLLGYLWCDEPATVAKKITNYTADAPVETVLIFASLAGMAEPIVIRHIQTIATRLAPLLAG